MRRITIALMTTISGLALLFSYHTSTNSPSAATALDTSSSGQDGAGADPSPTDGQGGTAATPSAQPTGDAGTPSATPSPDGQTTAAAPSPTEKKKVTGTFTGDPVMTQWGIVQVRIVVKQSFITGARAIRVPDGNDHDIEINNYAVPVLNQRVVDAQSADFDSISGATVTSDGYKQSLQTAIDKAHL